MGSPHLSDDGSGPGLYSDLHPAVVGATAVDVTQQVGWDPIAADNSTALVNALAAANAAGGGDVTLPRSLGLGSAVTVGDNVNLQGRGSGQDVGASAINLLNATAQIRFGTVTAGGGHTSGGISSGFRINGQDLANIPFYVGCVAGRSFKNIDIVNAVDAGALLAATQNCHFETFNIQHCGNDCLRVDQGAGTNRFTKNEYGNAGRYNVNIVATVPTANLPAGVQGPPLNNVWDTCIMEYDKLTTLAMLHIAAGTDNVFANSIGVANNTKTLIHLERVGEGVFTGFRWVAGTLQFNYSHADTTIVRVAGNSRFLQDGTTNIVGVTTVGRYDGALAAATWGNPVIPEPSTVWSVLTNGALYYNVRSALDVADSVAVAGAGTYTKRRAVYGRNGQVEGWLHLFDQ